MKNRERILNTSTADFLLQISSAMSAYNCDCIMDALDDDGRVERCLKNGGGGCRQCISDWLNEEENARR